MKELRTILIRHAERYPEMQPEDAVKLIYQNVFGGGHLIRDRQSCLNYLLREYEAVEKDPDMPRCEDIGNGMVRVYLAALEPTELNDLGEAFLASAGVHRGNLNDFLEKLEVLRALTREGVFAFDEAALEQYLSEYEKAGYPAVSHSQIYRTAYHPAYRIVCRDKWNIP